MNTQFMLHNVTVVVEYRDPFIKMVFKNVLVFVLGLFINYINIIFMHTFCKHQMFYTNPRYILFFHLVLNNVIQVNVTLVLFFVSYILYTINMSVCVTLILLALFTTENMPLNLACMAAECYIAVCLPLQHARLCTVNRTLITIVLIWTTSLISVLPDLFITLATKPLDFFSSRVFCMRENAFPNPLISKKKDSTYIVYLILVWSVLFYTYFMILCTAQNASKDGKKARTTILLHSVQVLLCMTTYAAPIVKTSIKNSFPKNYSDSLFASYIIVQILPRAINPVIYGVRDKCLSKFFMHEMSCKSVGRPNL
ncbi:odorant receptor 131-2-like [Entelurus aequoreus]|uniref:odorant receptor 131-2-like n=1 Tax=Entelurus aequoreus TaxID=161455 RepID=UPI002B1DDBB8|nr:odorant receptor 131-2-like [Entelurus aequoreus]XP_061896853.1 odorant receptor 131-2-like [Entelurus aequoreus]